MFSSSTLGVLVGTLFLIASIPDAASYTKYGRSCKDIGCRRDEVCVMAEDPCSIYQRDNCGRYPTCSKVHPGGANCESTVCRENEYCKTENGIPTCVKRTASNGYESAGVSAVNGQRINTDSNNDNHDKISNTGTNTNPYANANAPPAEPAGGYRPVSSGTNFGYPPYPSNTGTNNGYPAYPPSNQGNRQQDLGYPPYPTQNRMPMPGYPGQQNPGYPVPPPGYPQAPGYPQQYPGHQNYPYSNFPNYNRAHHDNVHSVYRYKGSASERSASLVIVCLTSLILLVVNIRS